MKQKAGFTMVEMMVVIAVLSIVAATAGPAVVQYTQARSSNAAASGLYATLHQYRSIAIKKRLFVTINISEALNQYQIDLLNPATGAVTNLPPFQIGQYTGSAAITNDPDTGTASVGQISFTNQGTCPAGSSGAVYLANADGSFAYRVRTTLAGGISMHKWNVSNLTWYDN